MKKWLTAILLWLLIAFLIGGSIYEGNGNILHYLAFMAIVAPVAAWVMYCEKTKRFRYVNLAGFGVWCLGITIYGAWLFWRFAERAYESQQEGFPYPMKLWLIVGFGLLVFPNLIWISFFQWWRYLRNESKRDPSLRPE